MSKRITLCCFAVFCSLFCETTAQTRVEIKPGLLFTCNGSHVIIEEDRCMPITITINIDSDGESESYYVVSCGQWNRRVNQSKLQQTIKEAIVSFSTVSDNTLTFRYINLLSTAICDAFRHD